MNRLGWTTALFIVATTLALANGAMGLGLEQWDPTIWLIYVAVIVLYEAWAIGRWLKFGWLASLAISLGANALTGVCCGLGGLFAPFLHTSFVGSVADPNPFLGAVALLAAFAIPSALVETVVWATISRRLIEPLGQSSLLSRVFLVHAVGIPIGMAILLVPARPYLGREGMATYGRRSELQRFARDLQDYVAEYERWPNAKTVEALLKEVPAANASTDRDVMLYSPEYRRFDMGEAKRHPFVLNAALAGAKVDLELDRNEPGYTWYLRPPGLGRFASWGIQVDRRTGEVKASLYALPKQTQIPK